MSLIDDATAIGNALTQIDRTLQAPGLSPSNWQILYALRKHLDDEQRDLIGKSLNEADTKYQTLTADLKAASDQLTNLIGDLNKVGSIIATISQIASYADQILKLA